jgi:hypothetical protein
LQIVEEQRHLLAEQAVLEKRQLEIAEARHRCGSWGDTSSQLLTIWTLLSVAVAVLLLLFTGRSLVGKYPPLAGLGSMGPGNRL